MYYTLQEKIDRMTAYLRISDMLPAPFREYAILLLLEFVHDECLDDPLPSELGIRVHRIIMEQLQKVFEPLQKSEGVPSDMGVRLCAVCMRLNGHL